jgi:hypothetical protein
MNIQTTAVAGFLLTSAMLAPGLANASYVLDTGTPSSNTGSPVTVLSTTQFVAAEFDVTTANIPVTQLAAYLTQGSGNVNDTFTVDIYANAGFTGRASSRDLLYTTTGTFTANGWNDVTTNWTPTATGDYWVALQVTSTTQTKGLDLPGAGVTTTSGTAPAVGFAYAGSNGQYNVESTSSPTTPFGIQLTEGSPVPLPGAAWLLLSGVGALGVLARRRGRSQLTR